MRNYPQFFLFVSSVLVSALFVLAGALYLLLGWVLAGASTDMPILRIIALGTTIPWCCVVLFLVTTLLGFHVYLIYNGLTTNEYFRKKRAQRRISMTPPAPTEHNNHNRGGVWYCWTLPWASATTNNNTTSSRQVTTSDDVYNSITTSAEGEDLPTVTSPGGENLTTEAGGLQLELNNLNYPTPTHPTQTAQEGNGGAKYSAGERMLRATADLMLTPLFDAEATPFPHLSPGASPSPSPLSPQYSPELRHPYREPPRGVLPGDAAAGGGNSTNDASNFESGTDPAYSSQRAEIPSSDRIIKLYNHRPTLTLTLPPIEEVKSESDNGFLSAELSQAARTQDSAVATVRTVALKDVLQRRGCCVSCTAVVCLPCLVVKHCGRPATYDGDRVRASTGAHTNDNNSPPYRPNSPSGSVKGDRNERYTYAYFCGCVPIVPHSRLLPLWQYEDERDTQQQEEMLEVLFDQLRVALRREALDSSADFSV